MEIDDSFDDDLPDEPFYSEAEEREMVADLYRLRRKCLILLEAERLINGY